MKPRKRLDMIAAHESVGSYRGAAELYGTTHKTVIGQFVVRPEGAVVSLSPVASPAGGRRPSQDGAL